MTKKEAARILMEQGGVCEGIYCENCPCFTCMCTVSDGTKVGQKSAEAVRIAKKYLEENDGKKNN